MASVENQLETFCRTKGINLIEAMNVLKGEFGVVSDNAVFLADVAEEDQGLSIWCLEVWHARKQKNTLRV